MQDSLCGSMGPIPGAPRPSHSSCSKDYLMSKQPGSPMHQSSPSSSLTGDYGHPHSDLTNYSSSSSKSVMIAESPESPNLSSWIDMIDELIEPPLNDSPMLFSPSHEFTSHSLTPSYSSLSDNLSERQKMTGASGLPSTSHPFNDGVESAHDDDHHQHQIKQDHPSSQLFSQLDSNYRLLPHHHHNHQHYYNHQQQQTKSQFSQLIFEQAQQFLQSTNMRVPPSSKSPYNQPTSALHKVLSAPQLSRQPEPARSPRRSNLPPIINSSYSSPQSILHNRSNPSMNQSELGRFSRRNSMDVSENSSPHSYSPPSLPSSLPSMGYLSHRMNQQRSPVMPMQPVKQQAGPSLQRNISMPSAAAAAANGPRETMAPLQQTPNLPMVQLFETEHQDGGLRLVHLLLACAEAVDKENYLGAKEILFQLQQIVSTNGDSMQRVAAYFTNALHSRLTGTGSRSYVALRSCDPAIADEVLAAFQILYQACPYVKFAHFTSNQAIFEAFEGEDRVHIVDLDIVQGYQWPAFIQALAARPGGAPYLRITGVGMPLEAVQETGKRLGELAESLHVPFEFHAVGQRLENLKAYMIQRRIGEALAVNSVNRLHRLLSEPMSPLFGVLNMIMDQAPNIFTLVEQEASHNGPFFLGRFLEALHYYSAIFDSLDATLPQTSPERTKVEQLVLSNEITNIVACEGAERVERHEKLEKWRKMMEGIGFQNVPLSANAVNQSKLLLGLYPCDGYTLVEDRGSLLLGWQDRPIIGASAWRC